MLFCTLILPVHDSPLFLVPTIINFTSAGKKMYVLLSWSKI